MQKDEEDRPVQSEAGKVINAEISTNAKGYFGCVEVLGDDVRGWALHAGNEHETIAVDVLVDGVRAATAYCVHPRVDIAAITGRSNTAGFVLPLAALKLPDEIRRIADGKIVTLEFKVKGQDLTVPTLFEPAVPAGELRQLLGEVRGRDLSKTELAAAIKPYVDELASPESGDADVKLIAFYLPQFHPVPENDEWWGAGFTEWTNVSQAKPQFPGHYQPHIPGELGFYDLRLPDVREAQAKLARDHGIHGFCYYYYWFNGRRILERPLQEVLSSGTPDFPFCICWANETWSRRWDGSEHEVLLKQEHTPSSDLEFIRDVIPILKDPRYIRVNGAPLLMVYRASLFPDLRATADTWRRVCAEEGIPKVHLCVVESFGFDDPYSVGFDSSVQFPPHGIVSSEIKDKIEGLPEDFQGNIYDYEEVVEMEFGAPQPKYKRFPGVMLSWDNAARRKNKAHIFKNASPEMYEVWLRNAAERARKHLLPSERLVFVNAWNEWAEGTHLEPDVRYGRAYLEATQRALAGRSSSEVLLEYARKAGTLTGDELERWLRDIEAHLTDARSANAYASRIAKRNHSTVDNGTIMSSVPPYVLSALSVRMSGHVYIERVNAQSTGFIGAVIRRDQYLYVQGWCVHPEVAVEAPTISHLVMEGLGTKDRYYAPIFGRHARHDVTQALKDLPSSATLYSGFKAYVDVRDLPEGEYRVGLMQAGETAAFLNFVDGVVRVC